MYGSVSNKSMDKANSVAAACGFAAVVAVAGLVGYTAPSALYSATAVRPAVVTAPLNNVGVARSPMAAANVEYVQAVQAPVSSAVFEIASTFAPFIAGLTGMAALLAVVMRRKPSAELLLPPPIAMAATSGRPMWIPNGQAPAHLTGQYIGDRGFDPLGLSKDPKTFERMRISEVFHGRLAMLGIVGCIFPELFLQKGAWFDIADTIDVNKFGLIALQCIAPIEYWRGNGGFGWNGGETPDRSYPGFDPLGITTDDTKLRELKNGRLAMIGMLGLEVQNHITGQSPLANLSAHLANPIGANVLSSSVAMFAASGSKTNAPWMPSGRPLWFPGSYAPAYLKGEYPGDRGFDPAGMAADPKTFDRMRISEVFHGRLAMLAVVGAVVPDYISKVAWYDAPSVAGVGPQQVATAVLISGLPEIFRGLGGFSKDNEAKKNYPGFDPLNLTTDYTKEAEIKNGRLAMTAMLGLEAQHHVTGKSPVTNLVEHWANPLGANIAESLTHPWPVAMFAATGHKEGLWFPNAKAPAHLTGEYPADRGFDPVYLAADPTVYARMRVAEVFHGRLAMLGMVGCIVPEVLGRGAWFATDVDGIKLGFLTMAIAAPTEYWRGQGGFGWDKGATDRSYPGFDPLKLTNDRNKCAEIKNGRLAMAGLLGLAAQYQATGESPLANLAAHMANPVGVNITTTLAMFTTSGQKVRSLWFPNAKAPAWLDGTHPADRGFDPFGMSADPKTYERMRISEVFHGRLAMLGVVGCVYPELLGNGAWFEVSKSVDMTRVGLVALQCIAPLEYWRGNGGFGWNGEEEGRDRSYPGFDPLGLTEDSTKTAEIKNGRLAMLAMAGMEVQSHVTGQGPVANVYAHLADPLGQNIAANLMTSWPPVAMFAASGHKEGLWFPNVKPAAHLTGEYPADRGFDPLNLAADPTVYARMRVAEVFHGRLAMLGMVGCVVPEILGRGAWFATDVDGIKLGFLTMAIAAPTEYWRGQGGFGWDKGATDRSYPGFDPAKLTNDRNKCAEIKNGRLAMAGLLGLAAQYQATGESPLANLAAHMANPVGVNITTTLSF